MKHLFTLSKTQWNLVALNTFILFGYLAYDHFQPHLLARFALEETGDFLGSARIWIGILAPVVAGYIADQMAFGKRNQLVVITFGVSLAAITFMLVAFGSNLPEVEAIRFLLPFLVIVWLLSIQIFQSPSVSMIEVVANPDEIPRLVAVIGLFANLTLALQGVWTFVFEQLGATSIFLAGGVLIFILGQNFVRNLPETHFDKSSSGPILDLRILAGFFIGLFTGIANQQFETWVPSYFSSDWQTLSGKALSFTALDGFLVAVALIGFLGFTTFFKLGVNRLMAISLAGLLVFSLAFRFPGLPWGLGVVLAGFALLFLSGVSISSIPFVLANAKPWQRVTAMGFFFAGVQVAGLIQL